MSTSTISRKLPFKYEDMRTVFTSDYTILLAMKLKLDGLTYVHFWIANGDDGLPRNRITLCTFPENYGQLVAYTVQGNAGTNGNNLTAAANVPLFISGTSLCADAHKAIVHASGCVGNVDTGNLKCLKIWATFIK